ncbi:MAG: GH25 family lysozyme, partial [bacterium]|nr:GH25 family lysozyme [bacterium]
MKRGKGILLSLVISLFLVPFLSGTVVSASNVAAVREGIDVSGYTNVALKNNGHGTVIDWKAAKAAGKQFVMIRCGYRGPNDSEMCKDSYFAQNLKGALDAGLDVGVYYVSQALNETEAVQEADAAVAMVNQVLSQNRAYELRLPIAVDFEDEAGHPGYRLAKAKLSVSAHNAIANAFCSRIESKGFTSMVYTNKSNLKDHFTESYLTSKYPLFYAAYNKTLDNANAAIWQYTNAGVINGIGTTLDFDKQYIKTPAKVTNVKATVNAKFQTNLSWSKTIGVYGYQVYRTSSKDNKEVLYATIKGAGKTTFTDTKMEKGVMYTYRVRAMVKTNTKNYYGAFSSKVTVNRYKVTLKTNKGTIKKGNVTSYIYGKKQTLPTKVVRKGYTFGGWYTNAACTKGKTTAISTTTKGNKTYYAKWNKVKVSTPVVKSIKNKSSKKIEVILKKKVSNANGYLIKYSTNSNMKAAKTVTITKNSTLKHTISHLKKGKKYYVQVCGYHNDSTGAKVCSKYTKKV